MSGKTKKIALSAFVIAALIFYIVSKQTPPAPTPDKQTGTPATTGTYKDGEYTGKFADAFYGPMQVKAVIQGGKITDVQFLQYPNKPGRTTEISNTALPKLKSEAIAAQSANVDIVSGATQDAEAFRESMADALKQAQG
jgi:uncharacterized protein with FMN-binding domain